MAWGFLLIGLALLVTRWVSADRSPQPISLALIERDGDIQVVIVYMSSHVMQVVGEFSVEGIITDAVHTLWDKTGEHAGIERQVFLDYFSGKTVGHAIKIGNVTRYDKPRDLQEMYGVKPPQSFLYL